MTIRFLDIVESSAEGFPFMPGQVIRLTGMTPEARRWLREGRAEVVREEPDEVAVVAPPEHAVTRRAARR